MAADSMQKNTGRRSSSVSRGNGGGDLTLEVVKSRIKTPDGQMIPTGKTEPRDAGFLNRDTVYSNTKVFERYGHANAPQSGKIEGMHSYMPNQALDVPGFDANGGCFHKWGTPYGEAAYFNQLPPGPDINDQAYALIHDMPLEVYHGGVTYESDTPWPVRDIPE